jgi:multiple sugar transport system substrate-binding protein
MGNKIMKYNKIFLFFLLVILFVLFSPIIQISPKPQQEPIIVVFLTGVQTTTTLNEIITRFNDKNLTTDPELDFIVNLEESTWETESQHDTYVTKLSAQDSTFDVISMDVIWPTEFASKGFLEPLDNIFPVLERDDFILGTIETAIYNNNIYSIPWFHDSGMLYFRTDILEEAFNQGVISANRAPQTWNELYDWTINIMSNSSIPTLFNINTGFSWQAKSYNGLICDFMEYIGGAGINSFLNQNQTSAVFSDPRIQDALEFMKSLIDDGVSPTAVLTYAEEESRAVWQNGHAIFHRNWSYAYRLGLESVYLNGTEAGTGTQVFDVAPMPAKGFSGINPHTNCLGGWQLGVNTFSSYKEEAKKFIRWLTEEEQQVEYFLGAGQNPTRKALYTDNRITTSPQGYVEDFFPAFDNAIPRPTHPEYLQMSEAIRGTINSYLSGVVNLASATATMNNAVNNILNNPIQTTSPSTTGTTTSEQETATTQAPTATNGYTFDFGDLPQTIFSIIIFSSGGGILGFIAVMVVRRMQRR